MADKKPDPPPAPKKADPIKGLLDAVNTAVRYADALETRAADDLRIEFGSFKRAQERLHLAQDDLSRILPDWGPK